MYTFKLKNISLPKVMVARTPLLMSIIAFSLSMPFTSLRAETSWWTGEQVKSDKSASVYAEPKTMVTITEPISIEHEYDDTPTISPTASQQDEGGGAVDGQVVRKSATDGRTAEPMNVDADSFFALHGGAPNNLWERIRQGFGIKDLQTPLVEDRTHWYASRVDYLQRMVARSSRYLYHIVEELERRHMPTELALLPFIESAFSPNAKSSAKAVGMWQFMPGTGRDFNLKQNVFRDERRDVLASTRAALDYLQQLYVQFGDWHLALAAYNWGQGSVAKAIARNQRAGLPTDYESLKMPLETRYYVPKLQAVKNLIATPEAFAVRLPEIDNNPYFVTVTTQKDIDVNLAANLAQLSLDEFKALNPSFNRPVIIGASKPKILLPFKNAQIFQANLSDYKKPLASWTAVQVNQREKVDALAKRLGVTSQTLRMVNNIPKGMRLLPGSTLVVPRAIKVSADISPVVAENAALRVEPDTKPLRKVYVNVRKSDTASSLASRYGVSVQRIRAWNNLSANRFPPGKKVLLYLPTPQLMAKKGIKFDRKSRK